MTIERPSPHGGIDVHFDPAECELFIRLALDAETAAAGVDRTGDTAHELSYFSISVALGQKIRALTTNDFRSAVTKP